jgi:hypothetical protein
MNEYTNPEAAAPDEKAPEETVVPAQDAGLAEPVPVETTPAQPKQRFRDRVYGVRSIAAVGIAGLVLGGAGGLGVGALAGDDHGDRDRDGRMQFSPQMMPGLPPGAQGQLPPGVQPRQTQPDGSSDDSGDSSSG